MSNWGKSIRNMMGHFVVVLVTLSPLPPWHDTMRLGGRQPNFQFPPLWRKVEVICNFWLVCGLPKGMVSILLDPELTLEWPHGLHVRLGAAESRDRQQVSWKLQIHRCPWIKECKRGNKVQKDTAGKHLGKLRYLTTAKYKEELETHTRVRACAHMFPGTTCTQKKPEKILSF